MFLTSRTSSAISAYDISIAFSTSKSKNTPQKKMMAQMIVRIMSPVAFCVAFAFTAAIPPMMMPAETITSKMIPMTKMILAMK